MLALFLHIRFLDSNVTIKFIISVFCSTLVAFKLNVLTNLKKCPECYGTELCNFFQNQQIQLTWFGKLLSIINPSLTKSVFHGVFNESEKVVIKRKAGRFRKLQLQNDLNISDVMKDFELNENITQTVILCPGFRDVKFLFKDVLREIHDRQLWLDLRTSIEPLLLLHFHFLGKWPVPKFYGACGELIMEEYKGQPLSDFVSSDFKKRAFLAIQLLKMAHQFTFQHPKFIFYFTDLSLLNLAVDSYGNVSLIDLDSVIIFDKSAKENIAIKDSIHKSEVLDQYEYAFSPSDICDHSLSDHNYFSVCKYLLKNPKEGLLREVPNSGLKYLLNECSEPKEMSDRISAGQKLELLLREAIKDFKWEQ